MNDQSLMMITVGISLTNKDKLTVPSIRKLDWDLNHHKNFKVISKKGNLYILQHYNHYFKIHKIINFRKKIKRIQFEAHLDETDTILYFGNKFLFYLDLYSRLVLIGFSADYTRIKIRKTISVDQEGIEPLLGFNDFENVMYLPRLRKLAVGILNKGIVFLHGLDGEFKSTFIKTKMKKLIYANSDIDPDNHSKSANVIQNYGFFEYILILIGKQTIIAIDPDSHCFLDKQDPENPDIYIPKKVKFSNGLGETP